MTMEIHPEHPAWEKAMRYVGGEKPQINDVFQPHRVSIEDWYKIAQQAIVNGLEQWRPKYQDLIKMPVAPGTEAAAKFAVDAVLPLIVEEVRTGILGGYERDIPEGFVSKYFMMNPETDAILFDGHFLMKDMTVLIEDPVWRQDIFLITDEAGWDEARMWNRWCTVVSDPYINIGPPLSQREVEFIGEFEDGRQRKFKVPLSLAWFVKKDTVPALDRIMDLHSRQVFAGSREEVKKVLHAMLEGTENYHMRVGKDGKRVSIEQYLDEN